MVWLPTGVSNAEGYRRSLYIEGRSDGLKLLSISNMKGKDRSVYIYSSHDSRAELATRREHLTGN